jgi:ubiquitin-conjugating enzyme E2 D/E
MANSKRAITAHLAEFKKNPPPGCNAAAVSETDIEHWNVTITGPPGSPYEGGIFKLTVAFPPDFPKKGPSVLFVTKIWHPLVNPDGQFCIPVLANWVVSQKTVNVFKALVETLANPSGDHAANAAVAEEFVNDPDKFRQTAAEWTRQYAV